MSEIRETTSRRDFFRKVAQKAIDGVALSAIGGTMAVGLKVGIEVVEQLTNNEKTKPNFPVVPPTKIEPTVDSVLKPENTSTVIAPIPIPPELHFTPTPEIPDDIKRLNKIASQKVGTMEREQAELEYIEYLSNKGNKLVTEDIDRGLYVTVDIKNRAALLQFRHIQRIEQKDPRMKILPADKASWAQENGISPDTLAVVLDAYPKAGRIVEAILKYDRAGFRPDIKYREEKGLLPKGTLENLKADQIIINPGGLAMLVITETGGISYEIGVSKDPRKPDLVTEGFTNVGNRSAWDETNLDVFPSGHISLDRLAEMLKMQTMIDFQPRNIPGSARGDNKENASGGAVGVQIMPDNVMEIVRLINNPNLKLSDEDRRLNIFRIDDAVVMALVFIARGVKVLEPDGFRTGYLKGPADPNASEKAKNYYAQIRRWALEKWNPHKYQVNRILNAANSYYEKFESPIN